jgi:uncharacterized protein YybS (DUF2232 family)
MDGRRARRVVLIGAGLGLGLALLEITTPRGWWGGLTVLVSFLPVALALALGGPWAAGVAAGVALAAVGWSRGVPGAMVVGLKYVVPGAALGAGLARRLSVVASALLTAGASIASLALLVWALAPAGLGPVAYLERQLEAQVAELEAWPARVAGTGAETTWAADAARVIVAALRLAGPGMIALGVLAGALANYLAARLCLRRLPGFRPFAREAVPDHFVWAVIVAGILLASGREPLQGSGLNLLLVLTPLYAIQGLAVLRHFLQRVAVPRLLQVLSFGLFAVQPVLLVAVACVGLSDLWIDFRKIRQAPTPASG